MLFGWKMTDRLIDRQLNRDRCFMHTKSWREVSLSTWIFGKVVHETALSQLRPSATPSFARVESFLM